MKLWRQLLLIAVLLSWAWPAQATLVVADRVQESTTSTGTGTISLLGAATGYRTFLAGIGAGNTTYYVIAAGSQWEVGIGTVTAGSPATLSRDTVTASSNAGGLVNFSAGTKAVFGTVAAAKYPLVGQSATCSPANADATHFLRGDCTWAIPASAANIDTVGTITTGTWSATAIDRAHGGTGQVTSPDDNVLIGDGTVWALKALPNCVDTAGNHLNYTAASNTLSCGTSGGGGSISGLTTGKLPKAASSSTLADSLVSESGTTVTVGSGASTGIVNAGSVTLNGTTSGTVTIKPQAIAGTYEFDLPTTAGSSGDVLTSAGGSGAPMTWTAAATASSTATFTNKTLHSEGTGNVVTSVGYWDLDLVAVAGGTALHVWNDDPLRTTCTPLAVVGTNRTTGYCTFPDSDGAYGKGISKVLPDGWVGAIDAAVWWRTTGTGNARFQFQILCYADDEVADAAFNTSDKLTAAAGTSGRNNVTVITGLTTTGCAAGELARIRFSRDRTEASDTLNAALDVEKVVFKYRYTK